MITETSSSRHVVFTGPRRVELQERDVSALGPRDVLVQTKQTLISTGTELTVLRGEHSQGSHWDRLFKFPWVAGYCNVGTILKVGIAVTRLKPGDRVASSGPHGVRVIVCEEECLAIPSGVSDDAAVFASIAQIVMQGVRLGHVCLGENGVICGLGLLGQVAIAFARHLGCWPLLGVDLNPFRQQLALQMGATAVSDPDSALQMIRERIGERLADVVFEVTGNPKAIPTALAWTRKMGRFVIISSPSGATTVDFHDMVNARGTVIIGAHNFTHPTQPNEYNRWTRQADTALYLALADAGILNLTKLITHRFAWDQAPEAYEQLLKTGEPTLGVVLDWDAAK